MKQITNTLFSLIQSLKLINEKSLQTSSCSRQFFNCILDIKLGSMIIFHIDSTNHSRTTFSISKPMSKNTFVILVIRHIIQVLYDLHLCLPWGIYFKK